MKKITRIIVVSIILTLICILYNYKVNFRTEKSQALRETFTNVKIIDDRGNMQKLYSRPDAEEFVLVDMIIGDRYYADVGIRTKGSSIYSWLDHYKSQKFSYKVKLDYINRNQEYNGLKELHLNSQPVDTSEIREYIVYELSYEMGIDNQQYGLGSLEINDKKIGLITIVEVITEDYVEAKYNSKNGNLYKAEVNFSLKKFGPDLNYNGDDIQNYSAIFENVKTSNTTEEDNKRLVSIIRKLNEAKSTQEIEECFIDFDKIIKYVAIAKATSNVDSFIGKNIRNSYLYEENGKIDIIPFDYNLSLGTIYNMWSKEEMHSIELIEVDEKIHSKIVDIILQNDEYHEKYKEYLRQVLNKLEMLYEQGIVDNLYVKVSETVKNSEERTHTYDEFLKEKQALEKFIESRIEKLKDGYLNLVY